MKCRFDVPTLATSIFDDMSNDMSDLCTFGASFCSIESRLQLFEVSDEELAVIYNIQMNPVNPGHLGISPTGLAYPC